MAFVLMDTEPLSPKAATGNVQDSPDAGGATTAPPTCAAPTSRLPPPRYRPVQPLPYELRENIRVFLEERMYYEAIQLLTSLLAAGGSRKTSAQTSPLWTPPPSHLALLATLAIHPAYTTRPADSTDLRVAGRALQYLRHILTVAGPVQADLVRAFQFRDVQGRPLGRARGRNSSARGSLSTSTSAGASTTASAAASRSHSARPLRRRGMPGGRPGGGTRLSSEYVDIRTVALGDEAEYDDQEEKYEDPGSARLSDDAAASGWGLDENGGLDGDDDDDAINGRMATRDSVWVRGRDFWHVVSWALNCSVREPARWRCWRRWLELVVDVLEADLAERVGAVPSGGESDDPSPALDSLLFQYLCPDAGDVVATAASSTSIISSSHARLRRIAAAVVVSGPSSASASFSTAPREVFDKETVQTGGSGETAAAAAAAAAASVSLRTRVLDLDNNKFGDYDDDDESAPSTPVSAGSLPDDGDRPMSSSPAGTNNNPGFLESMPLRLRLMHLVALGSAYFPEHFVPAGAVYEAFANALRDADIGVYASFLAAPPPLLSAAAVPVLAATPDDALAGLLRYILFTYVPASAPHPHAIDPAASPNSSSPLGSAAAVSARVLERCYLPFTANTTLLGANVRMGLAVEALLRLALRTHMKSAATAAGRGRGRGLWTPVLHAAAERGVQAREARVWNATAGGNSSTVALGRDMLRRSGRRIMAMVEIAEKSSVKAEMLICL